VGKVAQGFPALIHQHGQVAAIIAAGIEAIIVTVALFPGVQAVQHSCVQLPKYHFVP